MGTVDICHALGIHIMEWIIFYLKWKNVCLFFRFYKETIQMGKARVKNLIQDSLDLIGRQKKHGLKWFCWRVVSISHMRRVSSSSGCLKCLLRSELGLWLYSFFPWLLDGRISSFIGIIDSLINTKWSSLLSKMQIVLWVLISWPSFLFQKCSA